MADDRGSDPKAASPEEWRSDPSGWVGGVSWCWKKTVRNTHNPDGCEEQADLDAGCRGHNGTNDDGAVKLSTNADADDSKVHEGQRPKTPVDQDSDEVPEGPGPRMVDPTKVMVVNDGVLARKGFRCGWKPLQPGRPLTLLSRRKGAVGKPPEQAETKDDGDEAVDEEHPAETYEATKAIHELEAGRYETHDGSRKLGSRKVHADSLAGPRRRVEQGQIVGHSRPHACNDNAKQEPKQSGGAVVLVETNERGANDILDTPGTLYSSEAGANDASGDDDSSHPDPGAQLGHDQVRGTVEDDIGDVEKSQRGRRIACRQPENRHQVMTLRRVHGLGDADIGPDGRAEEIQCPEGC
ncbi:hypothetical protein CTA2_1679 [Colletotrichum tanaceti]|nr:hypothetical protein CTA2_1679 [Colletotrichum tanaceti]